MHPLLAVWLFTRERLRGAYDGLNDEQLRWRPWLGAHCIGEYLLHIAGAEHYWSSRMIDRAADATDFEAKLDRAVKDGFLREAEFPFSSEELTRPLIERALDLGLERLRPIMDEPTAEQLAMPLISPIGDSVTGQEGLVRVAQHAAYHTGQIWLIRMHPDFPA